MSEPYRFSGMSDFVAREGLKPSFAAKIPSLYFVARVSEMLSQIPTARPEDRPGMYAVAREAIEAMEACVETCEAALSHVAAACPPEKIEEPKAKAMKPAPAASAATATAPETPAKGTE